MTLTLHSNYPDGASIPDTQSVFDEDIDEGETNLRIDLADYANEFAPPAGYVQIGWADPNGVFYNMDDIIGIDEVNPQDNVLYAQWRGYGLFLVHFLEHSGDSYIERDSVWLDPTSLPFDMAVTPNVDLTSASVVAGFASNELESLISAGTVVRDNIYYAPNAQINDYLLNTVSTLSYDPNAKQIYINGTSTVLQKGMDIYYVYELAPVTIPVRYVTIGTDGITEIDRGGYYTDGNVLNSSPTDVSVTSAPPFATGTSTVGTPTSLVRNYNNVYSGYSYALGDSTVTADGSLFALTQEGIFLKRTWDGVAYSHDGVEWTLWDEDANGELALYLVYYPSDKVYFTVTCEITGPMADLNQTIDYSYEIYDVTTRWAVTRSGNNNNRRWTVGDPVTTTAATPGDSGTFSLNNGESKIFVLSNIVDPAYINSNTTVYPSLVSQNLIVTQTTDLVPEGYTLTITDDNTVTGTPNVSDRTYTIPSVSAYGTPNPSSGNNSRTYTPAPTTTADTEAVFTNNRPVVSPTGVDVDHRPYIVLFTLGLALAVPALIGKKKKRGDA